MIYELLATKAANLKLIKKFNAEISKRRTPTKNYGLILPRGLRFSKSMQICK